ncbi:hypothetical protein PybrP1_009183 [[Pythium] brassicae (nom. inval.)]|nr:hypothetical protein PybrP1_009183 [[Pythium] brassicae (nom. inval.)]
MIEDARAQLQNMEISCKHMLSGTSRVTEVRGAAAPSPLELLQLQVVQLQRRLLESVRRREHEDVMFRQAMEYASAKSTANAVLHTLFDQAKAGKHAVLAEWLATGVIPTRDGLKHWKVDLRALRNDDGATLLHAAVGRTMAREDLKVKLLGFLLDTVGFDPNVRDLGRVWRCELLTSHAMYTQVVNCLLAHGCDPSIQDRAGLTALSSVRTLSQPYEDIVKALAAAEKRSEQKFRRASESIVPGKALASALFLKGMARFVRPGRLLAFSRQTASLLSALLEVKYEARAAFDQLLRAHVPMLFDAPSNAAQVVRLETLFLSAAFRDSAFTDDLRVEIDGYDLSMVSQPFSTSAIAGPTWIGVLLKLIHSVKNEGASCPEPASEIAETAGAELQSQPQLQPQPPSQSEEVDIEMELESERVQRAWALLPPSPVQPVPFPPMFATGGATIPRQAWHYAVLFKASTHPFPGTLVVTKGSTVVVMSEDVSKYFPLEDRLLIGKDEYFATDYNPQTLELRLDRPFEAASGAGVKAYLSGSNSTLHPPIIKAKQILEREPGNKYEDQNSDEQELFQDYQFMSPGSVYEVAVKLGPVTSAKDARLIAEEWKRQCREHFEAKRCISGVKACEHYCPQRSGHSLCCETMAVVGKEIAKTRFGRPTFSRALKPRAALQKYQDRFKGSEPWPGSPSTTARAAATGTSGSSGERSNSSASRSLGFSED